MSPSSETGESSKAAVPTVSSKSEKMWTAALPRVTIPGGGGSIRGMGEKFKANAATGTGKLSVPIATSHARRAMHPDLELVYDSGAGNGEFGLGWSLTGLPRITRKTSKGVPRYQDEVDTDIFLLSDTEDLVPVFEKPLGNGDWVPGSDGQYKYNITTPDGFEVKRYRPRTEGLFAHIERWKAVDGTHDIFWRTLTGDGTISIFGKDDRGRVYDIDAGSGRKRVFSWLIQEQYDQFGNAQIYSYKAEDSVNVLVTQANEYNRAPEARKCQRYLKSIKYGNTTPILDVEILQNKPMADLHPESWMFEVVFDYGEHDLHDPKPNDSGDWLCRMDPISVYTAGFEIRTYRLCQRILMFHHFPLELEVDDYLVSATEIVYDNGTLASLISSIRHAGFALRRDDDPKATASDPGPYMSKRLPPLEFVYQKFPDASQLQKLTTKHVDKEDVQNLPDGIQRNSQFVDLYGEGLVGIFTEESEAWFYRRNLSPDNAIIGEHGHIEIMAKFGYLETVLAKPNLHEGKKLQFLDLSAQGQMDIVQMHGDVKGYYHADRGALDCADAWLSFQAFASFPNIDMSAATVKVLDLTGDGTADILVFEDQILTWYEFNGESGYNKAESYGQALGEDLRPRVIFTDPMEVIQLADMSGDGLVDVVRIRNGDVSYWPNLGYGKFGSKVAMDAAPYFESENDFSPKRLLLGDMDGSGTTDLIYFTEEKIQFYRNQCGNSWSPGIALDCGFPPLDHLASVAVVDLLGTGTMSIVWSSSHPTHTNHPLIYIDLMNGVKPYLLSSVKNNMGREDRFYYKPSTAFYLQDSLEGRPWATRLPYPVQCLVKTETFDYIGRTTVTEQRSYHHGYYDGIEREFRGFGFVESWRTETIENINVQFSTSDIPIVHIKQWYNTGALADPKILNPREYEYFQANIKGVTASASTLPGDSVPKAGEGISAQEEREGARALKGTLLREEIYGDDGTVKSSIPYKTIIRGSSVVLVQPQGQNQHAVFYTFERETIICNYEREIDDPRISHELVLQKDDVGNTLKSVTVSYGRRPPKSTLEADDKQQQENLRIVYSENEYTNEVHGTTYRHGQVSGTREFELTQFRLPTGREIFKVSDFWQGDDKIISSLPEIDYADTPSATVSQKRMILSTVTRYRSDDLENILPKNIIQSMALPGVTYRLSQTKKMLLGYADADLIQDPSSILTGDGGYVDLNGDGALWISDRIPYYDSDINARPEAELETARSTFFTEKRFVDCFGHVTLVQPDLYKLQTVRVVDPLGNVTASEIDYRTLKTYALVDLNGNRSEVAFDALGDVFAIAVRGKIKDNVDADSLVGINPNLTKAQIDTFFNNPEGSALNILKMATEVFIHDYDTVWKGDHNSPVYTSKIQREIHGSGGSDTSKIRISFTYHDGFARDVQCKSQGTPDPQTPAQPRWIGSKWTLYNSERKPLHQFDNFWDQTHSFQHNRHIATATQLYYDPLGRENLRLSAAKTWSKKVYKSWHTEDWDYNDTILQDAATDADVEHIFRLLAKDTYSPSWFDRRADGGLGDLEQKAALKSRKHANTPEIFHLDSLGRDFLQQSDIGDSIVRSQRTLRDVQGRVLETRNGLGSTVTRTKYDMVGHPIKSTSMDSGHTWSLFAIDGRIMTTLDSNRHLNTTTYDALRRPLTVMLRSAQGVNLTVSKYIWGEDSKDAADHNLLGKQYQVFDQAGISTTGSYDLHGNVISSRCQFAVQYKETLDWGAKDLPKLEDQILEKVTSYDALSQLVSVTTPDSSQTVTTYNRVGLAQTITTNFYGDVDANDLIWTPVVVDTQYDPSGRHLSVDLGNGAKTWSTYDSLTKRLIRRLTTCHGKTVEDISYVYDPVGNIMSIRDDSQQNIYFRNTIINPVKEYDYDSVYRLTTSTSREHLGQTSGQVTGPSTYTQFGQNNADSPVDGKAMGLYTESYLYDLANNILSIRHDSSDAKYPGWMRSYTYTETSKIESGEMNNRLTSTSVKNITDIYSYDDKGNIASMPQLPVLKWDSRDQLQATSSQMLTNGGTPETTWYVYDNSGERVRKITERSAPAGQTPVKLKELVTVFGIETYQKYQGDGTTITLGCKRLKVCAGEHLANLTERWTGSDDVSGTLLRYQLSDHLHSVCIELDGEGNLISYEEYSAYGSSTYQLVISKRPKRFRFSSKNQDSENGFYYFGRRYYAAWLGRWINPDPIGIGDGLNVFEYVRGNPVRYTDPDGTQLTPADQALATQMRTIRQLNQQANVINVLGNRANNEGISRGMALPLEYFLRQQATAMDNAGPVAVRVQYTTRRDQLSLLIGQAQQTLENEGRGRIGIDRTLRQMPYANEVAARRQYRDEFVRAAAIPPPPAPPAPPADGGHLGAMAVTVSFFIVVIAIALAFAQLYRTRP